MKNKTIVKTWLAGIASSFIGGFIAGSNGGPTEFSATLLICGYAVSGIFGIWAMIRLWGAQDKEDLDLAKARLQSVSAEALPFPAWRACMRERDPSYKYMNRTELEKVYDEYCQSIPKQQNETTEACAPQQSKVSDEKISQQTAPEDRLRKVRELHDQGLISKEAMEEKNRELLAEF